MFKTQAPQTKTGSSASLETVLSEIVDNFPLLATNLRQLYSDTMRKQLFSAMVEQTKSSNIQLEEVLIRFAVHPFGPVSVFTNLLWLDFVFATPLVQRRHLTIWTNMVSSLPPSSFSDYEWPRRVLRNIRKLLTKAPMFLVCPLLIAVSCPWPG